MSLHSFHLVIPGEAPITVHHESYMLRDRTVS
jgi:hypothetical protein